MESKPKRIHATGDEVLSVLSNVPGAVGNFVLAYPGSRSEDDSWLDSWFVEWATKYFNDKIEAGDEVLVHKALPSIAERALGDSVRLKSIEPHYFRGFREVREPINVDGLLGKMYRVSRVAYELTKGEIPDGFMVMHTCDNPPCVNPAHLILGAPKENTQDMIQKRRSNIDHRAAQLLGADVKKKRTLETTLPFVIDQIKQLIASGVKPTMRRCASIHGYSALLGHYMRHTEILALAKGGEPSKP